MFEYLLPLLWMKAYPNTILEQTVRSAVRCQVRYGRRKGRPWGISEAAYCVTDTEGNFQYRAFGAPELALKDGVSGAVVAGFGLLARCAKHTVTPSKIADVRSKEYRAHMLAAGGTKRGSRA